MEKEQQLLATKDDMLNYYLSEEIKKLMKHNISHKTAKVYNFSPEDVYDLYIDVYMRLANLKTYKPNTKSYYRNYFFVTANNLYADYFKNTQKKRHVQIRKENEMSPIVLESDKGRIYVDELISSPEEISEVQESRLQMMTSYMSRYFTPEQIQIIYDYASSTHFREVDYHKSAKVINLIKTVMSCELMDEDCREEIMKLYNKLITRKKRKIN